MTPELGSDFDAAMRGARDGDRRRIARLLTEVERGGTRAEEVSRVAHRYARGAWVIGVTGAPGAGKSTLTSAMCGALSSRGQRVGVLAIDPSSPFSGGAILGDRIRMSEHALDPQVYVRSLATRGQLGGLSQATPLAIRVLDAAGFDIVIVETVGVGQAEIDIVNTADTTVVVINPGWGDHVQAAKAGLMEIADLFVLNKADRDGAGSTRRDLENALSLKPGDGDPIDIVTTVASQGVGTDELIGALDRHHEALIRSGRLSKTRKARIAEEIRNVMRDRMHRVVAELSSTEEFSQLVEASMAGRDPWSVAEELLATKGIDS